MSIKQLYRLDIGGDNTDQVALILSLQLCRAETAQSREHLVPQKCQEMKGNIMVAILLRIA